MTPPYDFGPGSVERTVEFIQWAESIGYQDVWLPDAGRIDALTLAAIALARTERMRVGIAVVPAFTRTPAVLAATVATLADIAPGRFALGLGSSSEAMIEGWHGLSLDRPLTRMRETLTVLQQMLDGKKTDFTGSLVRSTGYQQPPLSRDVAILLAALGPKMTELAVSSADGIILNLFPLQVLDETIAQIRAAAHSAGREPGDIEIGSRFQVAVTDNVDEARAIFRFAFSPYFTNPVYNRHLASAGYPEEAAAILEAGSTRDWTRARAAMTDDLVDSIAVIGDKEYCQERVRTYVRAGITTPMLFCLSFDPNVQRDTFAAFAPKEFQP
ncbi:LLM class flavin-dependent oxidoreductase [Smaragdicoccus niigatensis]|nr:LLM class flavin-dependent oxidoreductase [Smaragdicoccus niigatensis]